MEAPGLNEWGQIWNNVDERVSLQRIHEAALERDTHKVTGLIEEAVRAALEQFCHDRN